MNEEKKPFPDLSLLVAQESSLEIKYCRISVIHLFIHQIITASDALF